MKGAVVGCLVLLPVMLAACAPQASTSAPQRTKLAPQETQLQAKTLQTLTNSYMTFTFQMCDNQEPKTFESLPEDGVVLAGKQTY